MTRRITALFLTLCLIVSAAPVFAGAATGQQVCANAVTVTAGNTATVTLRAENFTNIAALDVYVYYDPAVFTVSSTSNGSMLSGAQTSVNTGDAGTVKLSAMSLNGISGSGNLLTVYFRTASDCASGTYPIEVAIGRAYDANLAPASIDGVNGYVTINKPVITESFSIYTNPSQWTLQKADVLSYRVRNSGSRSFVSAEFTVEYDYEVFAFESLELESALTGEGAVYSVNSNVPGQVRIAYANDDPVSSYDLFTVKLTVIADVDATTTVKAQAMNVYRQDLSAYQPGSNSSTLTLQKLPEVEDYPNVFLQTEELEVGRQSKSTFCVEAGAGIAAADFTVTYDPTVLRCVAVTVAPGVEEKGGMLILNETFGDGAVRFSYVNMDAYAAELSLVEIIWEPICSPETHYQTSISGVGVVNAEQNSIVLEYLTDSGCIFVPTVVPPTCLLDGYTDHACTCGENYQTDPTNKLGHDIQYFTQREPTCTQVGWNAHEGCSRCDYGDYVEIPALGHDEIFHEAQEQTCLEVGWDAYVTCSRCDYSTYQELSALGHRVIQRNSVLVDPISIQNNGTIPFEVTDDWYYSNNHEDYSSSEFTATALYDCSVNLIYGVSSETNYDKLYILKNGNQLDAISGTVSQSNLTVDLSAGEVLTVRYTKDVSVSSGDDRGWAKLEYQWIWIGNDVDVPAETLEPDCVNGVTCDYCDAVVKDALGHDYETVTVDATCTADGSATDTCAVCGDTKFRVIPATGHNYEAVVTAPTCTEAGFTTYTCTCGESYTADETAALGHSFKNGICTACGAADPDFVRPTVTMKYPTVSFEDEIIMNVFFSVENLGDIGLDKIGLLTFSSEVADGTVENADAVIPGVVLDGATGFYCANTNGIAAKNLGDEIYFLVYVELPDGSYVYSKMVSYSPMKYAYSVLNGNYGTNMKALVAAMLNYGAAAQVYFNHNTDALVNAAMTDAHKALIKAYSADMVTPVVNADNAKVGDFVGSGGFSKRYPTVSFEGAFCINYFFTPSNKVDGELTLYYWNQAAYNNATILTTDNATGALVMTGNGEMQADVAGIAAKDLDGTIYVAAVYTSNGTTYCSGVLAYSIGAYCIDRIANGSATMQSFAAATAVYGYYAKAYFAK